MQSNWTNVSPTIGAWDFVPTHISMHSPVYIHQHHCISQYARNSSYIANFRLVDTVKAPPLYCLNLLYVRSCTSAHVRTRVKYQFRNLRSSNYYFYNMRLLSDTI